MMTRNLLCWLSACALSLPLALGCGTADEATPDSFAPVEENGLGGQGGEEAQGGQGGAPADVPDPGPAVCPDASGVYQVEPAQSNLLFLVDRSGSMHLSVTASQTRWTLTKAGLFDIFERLPSQARGGVAMFPWGDKPITCCEITPQNYITCPACGPGELPGPALRCDPNAYHDLPVAMGALDQLQLEKMKALVSTVDNEFYWGTPLAPALDGALSGLTSNPEGGVTSVILLTDGLPTSCNTPEDPGANDVGRAVDAAATGFAAGIRTYVLGVIDGNKAADASALSQIAAAGGTARYAGCQGSDDCAYPVNVATFADDLQGALESIALEAISCSFELPDVSGGAPDYDAVNITITSGDKTITVSRDQTHEGGWDYLPGFEQVQLYGDACGLLKSDAKAKVDVVVGCKTIEG